MSWSYTEPRLRRLPLTTPVRPASGGGTGGPPTGPAGGDLTGTYPNPTLAPGAVGTTDLVDGAVTDAKITSVAYAKVTGAPTAFPPSGPAGGDLTGTYPNPTVGALKIGDAKISDVAWGKITGAPSALPPTGTAGGDLTGSYPNPTIAKLNGAAVGTTTPLARGDVLVAQSATPTLARLALGAGNMTLRSNGVDVIWAVNAPGGGAGGDLGGNYPNPVVGRLNGAQLGVTTPLARGDILVANSLPSLTRVPLGASGTVLQSNGTDAVWAGPPGGPPTGGASGDLTGTYPAPTVAAGAVTTTKLGDAPNGVTTAKLNDGAVTNAKIADVAWSKVTGAPTAFPPSGAASGDLSGTYPGPTVAKVNGAALGTTTPLARGDLLVANATPALVRLPRGTVNQVLQSDGTDVVWGPAPATGGPPTGAAGGSLAGSYPNPTLAASGVTAGTYGDQYNVPKVTLNAEGRVTAVVQVVVRARWG